MLPPVTRSLAAVVAITLAAGPAAGHVAPSIDDNNRYLKLTPLGDRVRLAYTVFFGEVPGAAERRAMDRNGDGRIDDAEARAFSEQLAAQVAAAVDVELDDHAQPVRWATVDVGMTTPAVTGGSFSVDLVTYLCLPATRGSHRVLVHDRFRVPHPGETEVRVEDSPGVTIDRARVGPADDPSYDYRFAGPGGPLSDDGLDLAFTAGPKALVTADGACAAAGPGSAPRGRLAALIAVPVALAGLAAGFVVARRRRR